MEAIHNLEAEPSLAFFSVGRFFVRKFVMIIEASDIDMREPYSGEHPWIYSLILRSGARLKK